MEDIGIRATRFEELGYRQDGPNLWRIYDIMDPDSPGAVGPHYKTKAELLADLEDYAAGFGCAGATSTISPRVVEVVKGLMEIAETAMPDTYFQTDSRVEAARKLLAGRGKSHEVR